LDPTRPPRYNGRTMAEADTIVVTVRLFAVYRERVGTDRLDISLPLGATVAEVMDDIARRYPRVASLATTTLVAVNQEYASEDHALRDGDEVALIPPVSGGDGGRVGH